MSHRTAATALLLASLPYGFALPQVIPLVNDIAPTVTRRPRPLTLPFAPEFLESKVTVIGTVVKPLIESLVEDVTDIIGDATETTASPWIVSQMPYQMLFQQTPLLYWTPKQTSFR